MPKQSLYDFENYRDVLEFHFNERKTRRKSYTLNAFARDLGISSARMSSVLSGRYGLSDEAATLIAKKLEFNKEQSKYFITLVASQHARTKVQRTHAKEIIKKIRCRFEVKESKSNFDKLYSKWYFAAAQMLLSMKHDATGADQLSQKLRISKQEADETLKTLESLGFIEKVKNGYLRRDQVINNESSIPSTTIRNFHKQILDEAKNAIDRVPLEKRKSRSTVFIFDSKKTDEARTWLEQAHEEFINRFGATDECDSVNAVTFQFFRVDEEQKDA